MKAPNTIVFGFYCYKNTIGGNGLIAVTYLLAYRFKFLGVAVNTFNTGIRIDVVFVTHIVVL
ncbi:hypothetical protein D3C87_972990 [compost metagenome]